jgi:hypothetical protein
MQRGFMIAIGGFGSVVLMVLALWCWQHAPAVAAGYTEPAVVAWAVRLSAVGLAAAAQAALLSFVVARVYRRGRLEKGMTWGAVMLLTLALVSALALGWAGR